MPYTKEELKNVEFYTDFVDELRNKYLTEISSSAVNNFRKRDKLYPIPPV